MIQKKLDKTLLVKAYGALKYATVSNRIVRSYTRYVNAKTRKTMFGKWRHRLAEFTAQKQKAGPILAMLDRRNKESAFN